MSKKTVLILGAGRSSGAAIDYLIENSNDRWQVWVADMDEELALSKTRSRENSSVFGLNGGKEDRDNLIAKADVVISMLPPFLHIEVAKSCLQHKTHLVTASYVDDTMKSLTKDFEASDLLFLGEMGVDPGIDHMSAMAKIDKIKSDGGVLESFKSYTGGLVDDSSDDNPWHYKVTWNPMNVVKAGQGVAQYLLDGKPAFVPYHRIFKDAETVEVLGKGIYEGYPNRNSLDYISLYGIEGIQTLLRGTLRFPGFCGAWDALIQLGFTEANTPLDLSKLSTYAQLTNSLLAGDINGLEKKVADYLGIDCDSEIMEQLTWLGLFSNEPLKRQTGTLGDTLYDLILKKWQMMDEDKDLVIMQHEFVYTLENQRRKAISTMVQRGKNKSETAMSKLVGLPLAIITKRILCGDYQAKGLKIPIEKEIYQPVLHELADFDVTFREWDVAMH